MTPLAILGRAHNFALDSPLRYIADFVKELNFAPT